MGEGQRRGGGSAWGYVIEGGGGVLRCSSGQGDERCYTRVKAVPLDLMVELERLRCGLASAASGFDGDGGGKVLVRVLGTFLYRGRCSGGRAGSYDVEFVAILDSFGFLEINPLLRFPRTLCSEVLQFLALGERSRGARADGVRGVHGNGVEHGGGRPMARCKLRQGRRVGCTGQNHRPVPGRSWC
jgi:hypothetical protein